MESILAQSLKQRQKIKPPKVSQLLKSNPNIKPSEIQSSCILSAFCEGTDWQKVEKEVEWPH
jgi:hypothetical protein